MSFDAEVAAIKSLIAEATKAPCMTHGEAQETRPQPANYTILYLSRRFGGNVRGGTRDEAFRRLQTRAVSKSERNAALIEDRTAEVFRHASHTVDGALVHFAFEAQDAAFERDDDGYYHRLTDYTFSI